MASIAVIDYGMGNLRSVGKALEHVAPQAQVIVTSNAALIKKADRVVFPGQGAMPDCMRELDKRGLRDVVYESASTKPFLGICIGLQMLFDLSEEGNVSGLGILPGKVRHFQNQNRSQSGARLKVPHMGWNQVQQGIEHSLWRDIPDNSRFYFVHSYYVEAAESKLKAALTQYGIPFTSACARDNIFAVQFHPEKSAVSGLALLQNFVEWNP